LDTINAYDEVPYPSQPVRHGHPARIGAIATLFGMQPQTAGRSRVLELGCGTGGNLIPMAERFPDGIFVGVDYSRVQIEMARQVSAALGLKNLELLHASIADLGDELGSFDYIICHGVYSWVSRNLQRKILDLCRTALNPQGVAYVSYNVYPAWHIRSIFRRLMCEQARQSNSSQQQMAEGRSLLDLLSKTVTRDGTPYGKILKEEIDAILNHQSGYLFHEYLEPDNEPLYFHEFHARAAAAGLRYLGDALSPAMASLNPRPATEPYLRRIAHDAISREQYWDVLNNRSFRQTLLCHQDIPLSDRSLSERLESLYFCGQFTPHNATPDFQSSAPETFAWGKGRTLSQRHPLVKAALYHLGRQWPRSLTIDGLADAVGDLFAADGGADSPATIRAELVQIVAEGVARGLIHPANVPDDFVTSISPRPLASPLARLQAQSSHSVTNRRHEGVQLDDGTRIMLRLLDGQHDQGTLLDALVAAMARGQVTAPPGLGALGATAGDALAIELNKWLTALANQALLIA
jgi:methyltransferase-like protein/2-polyprenyl-3-methyl-5-hydroxy-6-metoxy-1,4-benzoquinol methylase